MQSCPRADDTLPPDTAAAFTTTIPAPPPEMALGDPPLGESPRSASLLDWSGFASDDLDEET
jgi:hypothetical protein